jgi:hypothetical protein
MQSTILTSAREYLSSEYIYTCIGRLDGFRASPTGVVYRLCAKKDASLARGRIMVLQQRLQTSALKQSAWRNAIQGTIYSALENARGKHTTQTYTPKTIYFLEPQGLELLLEVNMALRPKSGSSALQTVFTAPKFKASVGDALKHWVIEKVPWMLLQTNSEGT